MKAALIVIPLLLAAIIPAGAADLKTPDVKAIMKPAADFRTQIDAANQAWLAAFAKGDAAALTTLYTDDATIMPPGAEAVKGREAITKFWQGVIGSGMKITTLATIAVDHHGPVAREIGKVLGTVPGPDRQPVAIEGKYVVYWKDLKGVWKLDTDIWNLNK